MEQITDEQIPNKNPGDQLTADEVNLYKQKINEAANAINAMENGPEPNDGNILDETTSNMHAQGAWVKQLGNPGMTFSDGLMTLTFATGVNQNVRVVEAVEVGKSYEVKMRARRASGDIESIRIGLFATGGDAASRRILALTNSFQEFNVQMTPSDTYFSIGEVAASNTGGVVEIDYLKIIDPDLIVEGGNENIPVDESIQNFYDTKVNAFADNVIYSNTSGIFGSLTKNGKKLLKIAILGDSLLANPLGGALPVEIDEGVGMRPMRLTYNNVARRIYDYLSFNKATHRRLSHSDWTKSGAWTGFSDNTLFEPSYNNEDMYVSTVANEYVEITVPDGQENFAFICKEGLSQSPLTVTLNGGDISAYGLTTVINAYAAVGHTGNPYKVVEYLGLPSGANVIRITRDATTSQSIIWGGFYWSGVTLIVQNIAHGGHTMYVLTAQHIEDEFVRNKFDAVYFEIPELNEMSLDSIESSSERLKTILGTYFANKDVLISSCNPFGTDPTDGTPNYYETSADVFTQKELNSALKKIVLNYQLPFVDLFSLFERKTIGLGGTLENGDAGQFTTDGQHGNVLGVTEWFDMLIPALKTASIKD